MQRTMTIDTVIGSVARCSLVKAKLLKWFAFQVDYGISNHLESTENLIAGAVVERSKPRAIQRHHPAENVLTGMLFDKYAKAFAESGCLKLYGITFSEWRKMEYAEAMRLIELSREMSKKETDAVNEALANLKDLQRDNQQEKPNARPQQYTAPGKRNPAKR